jgi:hypothetical protein
VYSAGANLELVAWGLRNAFGLHHYPDGRLFATEYGIDERSPHFIVGDPQWGDGGCGRDPVIAEPPGTPPEPFVSFTPTPPPTASTYGPTSASASWATPS